MSEYRLKGQVFVFRGFSHVPSTGKGFIEHIRIPLNSQIRSHYSLQWEHPNDTALPVKGNRFCVEDGILAVWVSESGIPPQCAALVFDTETELELRVHGNAVKMRNPADSHHAFIIQI